MKTYRGGRSLEGAVVTVDGRPLPPRYDLKRLSSTGFEWTYEGAGPAQLALADRSVVILGGRRRVGRHQVLVAVDAAGGLERVDARNRMRAGEVVRGREGAAVGQVGRLLDHGGPSVRAAYGDRRSPAGRPAELTCDHRLVVDPIRVPGGERLTGRSGRRAP